MPARTARLARLEAASVPTLRPVALVHCLHLTGEQAQAGPLAQVFEREAAPVPV